MELFFKEKLSINGKVEIADMEGNVVYSGKKAAWSGNLILNDENKKKIATITEVRGFFGIGRGYTIKVGKKKVAKIKKKLSLINQKFHVNKLDWDIKGNFVTGEYKITKGEEAVATIKKGKLIALFEGYSIDVVNPDDAINVLCVVLVINDILKAKKGKLLKSVTNR